MPTTVAPHDQAYAPVQLPVTFTGLLQSGSNGPDVYKLKCALMGLGFLSKSDPVADAFDAATVTAVDSLQRTYGLVVDGIVGPATAAAIDTLLRRARNLQVPSTQSGINERLATFYASEDGYSKVYHDVMGWFGTTHNGCVAFMSTALRFVGVAVPKTNDANGENISLVTRPFSTWLNGKFKKVADASKLVAGDIVLTQDDPTAAGYPAHTYLFAQWVDQAGGVALVVDNQSAIHKRNINEGGGGFNFTPYAYHFHLG